MPEESEIKTDGKTIQASGPLGYMVVVFAVVVAFIAYLERRDRLERQSITETQRIQGTVAELRIDQCHTIQQESINVIRENSSSSLVLAQSIRDWDGKIDRMDKNISENGKSIQEILMRTKGIK